MEESIILPTKEEYWKVLIDQKVLENEYEYVIVNNKKLEKIESSLKQFLNDLVKNKKLEIKTLTNEKDIIYFSEYRNQTHDDDFIFVKAEFRAAVGDEKYEKFEKLEVMFDHITNDKIECSLIETIVNKDQPVLTNIFVDLVAGDKSGSATTASAGIKSEHRSNVKVIEHVKIDIESLKTKDPELKDFLSELNSNKKNWKGKLKYPMRSNF